MKRYILFWLSLALMVVTMYMVFVLAPTEKVMGFIQKIFYLMVPMGWLALLAFLIVFIGSILYLVKKENKWDILARSAAETGIVFTSLTLIVGSLWAKGFWGKWWIWEEARLTSTLVLWFIYLAYIMVRSLATEESQGSRFAAVVGIIGFVDIPIVVLATTLWRGQHPPMLVIKGDIDPTMLLTLIISIIAFTILYFLILWQRVSLRNDEVEIEKLKKLIN